MKNQNDLIASIVALFLTIVVIVLCLFVFQRTPVAPTPATPVVTTVAALPGNMPVMAAKLPQGGSRAGGGGGGGMPSFGGAGGGMAGGPPAGGGAGMMAPGKKKNLAPQAATSG